MTREPPDDGRQLEDAVAQGTASTDEIRALIPHLTDQLREVRSQLANREERIRDLEAECQRLISLLDAATSAAVSLEEALERAVDKDPPERRSSFSEPER